MKKLSLIVIILVLVSSVTAAQVKTVHFKKLQEFLPSKEIKNFKRLKPSGTSQTTMGMSTSEAKVRYEEIRKDTLLAEGQEPVPIKTIDIKIGDMVAVPYLAMAFQMMGDSESESEESSQKTVMVKSKYKGQEEIYKGQNGSCKIGFAVANRYVITLEALYMNDVKVLYDLIDTIDLDNLEKLTTETK